MLVEDNVLYGNRNCSKIKKNNLIVKYLNIAILGDLHGHFTLSYRLLKRWEKENNETIDIILQVGDLGAFPPPFKVDKTAMYFAEKDPDELSFINYYQGSLEADEILGTNGNEERKIIANMYFIKGNHEDFEFLHNLNRDSSEGIPVHYYGKIFFFKNGSMDHIGIGENMLKIGYLGGIAYNNSSGNNPISQLYTKSEVRNLFANGENIDIFLTHDVPFNTLYEDIGSLDILNFIKEFQPQYHFCGHYHKKGQKIDVPGQTKSYLLNEVNFQKSNKVKLKLYWNIKVDNQG
jgi:Icc-related predicted phosphoesterase